MPKIKVNNNELEVEDGLTVLQACEQAGAEIPRFCYHEKLSIAGNCRMCLVEIEKSPKPVASCAMPVADGMNIKTNTEFVEKARKGVMEFLLANHPLDCPVCDQGGECDLQDQSMFYGIDKSRFKENKRFVPEKYMGPLIKTQMTRCIHCTRCIRFATEVAGVSEIGAIGRGEDTQITTYLEKSMESELSGNVIDLCPVGALTSKPYVFEARPWELKKTESIDVMDAVGSNIRIDTYGWEVKRILPKINENINKEWISDKTRYACDGLKYQRLDTPYTRSNDGFKKISWEDAYKTLTDKIKITNADKIGCITGELTNIETLFSVKELFNKILNCKNLDSRPVKTYVNNSSRTNYIFNTQISNIEKSDFILLVGTNPRHEATILNSRIRKSYLKNNMEIYSLNDVGDLTYPYKVISSNTDELKKIILNEHEVSKKIISAKNPIVIFGQSALKLNSSGYLFEGMKKFLSENNKINDDWNALNVLSNNASTVGAYDLDILDNETIDNVLSNQFELVFLFGQDNLNIKKKNEFIVYIGTHGDRGAEMADLILPSAAYTEQDGYYTNLEGNLQLAFKASYPPGEAKEDWEIVNEVSKKLKGKSLYTNKQELIDNLLNYLNQKTKKNGETVKNDFIKEEIFVDKIDYYFTNVIARSSKTMAECRNLKLVSLKTGTDG